MRSLILGVIVTVWGAAILIRHLAFAAAASGSPAYEAGGTAAIHLPRPVTQTGRSE